MSKREIGLLVLVSVGAAAFIWYKYRNPSTGAPAAGGNSDNSSADDPNASTVGDLSDGGGSSG